VNSLAAGHLGVSDRQSESDSESESELWMNIIKIYLLLLLDVGATKQTKHQIT